MCDRDGPVSGCVPHRSLSSSQIAAPTLPRERDRSDLPRSRSACQDVEWYESSHPPLGVAATLETALRPLASVFRHLRSNVAHTSPAHPYGFGSQTPSP
ncbi:hypothetical protein F2Q69_00021125 [Brassica cretica]|uniref:Uncharacterized protein n=1 Tax=Brassica cretica TaxID=69181 RepID=A0A8S9QIU8_BRACR|nr:hypothetical protein F2Q69_00021125 [Brassica cretica]